MKHLFLLAALFADLGLTPAGRARAQTFTTLHSFTATNGVAGTNGDGAAPYGGLILSGSRLYGTTYGGGNSGKGSVFAVNTDGTNFTNLHSFTARFGPLSTNSDGARPEARLVLSGNTLYGTAAFAGSSGIGTVFAVGTDGTGFTNLHNFTGDNDGQNPYAGLMLSGNTLYGVATFGGSSGNGTVFALNTNGTGFTNLHTFAAGTGSFPQTTNSDGANPYGRLIQSGNTLYGTAGDGGTSGAGSVFAVNADGTGFTNLHNLDPDAGNGFNPVAGLVSSGNTLYGTTLNGGSSFVGSVFKVNTDGTGFTTLHSFTPLSGPFPGANSDGASPRAELILSGHTLYGTAEIGGRWGNGTVFAVNTDGAGFTNLHDFTNGSDGAGPQAGLILSGNSLYGTAALGGPSGNGTIFRISLPAPQLTIAPSGPNIILSWPTNNAGFDYSGYALQSAPALTGPFTNLPAAASPYTNPIAGPQQFFRLSQ